MSDDETVLVRGREVDPSDLVPDEDSAQSSSIASGLVYFGIAAFLAGPMLAVQNLPTDLSTTTAADLQPATDPMLVGVLLVGLGGVVAVATSDPVQRLVSQWRPDGNDTVVVAEETSSQPATDGGDPLAEAGDDE